MRVVWAAGAILLAAVATVAAPSVAQPSRRSHEAVGSPRQGSFAGKIDIGRGRRLYLQCAGRGGPTLILESGIHDSSDVGPMTEAKPPVAESPPAFTGVARFTHACLH